MTREQAHRADNPEPCMGVGRFLLELGVGLMSTAIVIVPIELVERHIIDPAKVAAWLWRFIG